MVFAACLFVWLVLRLVRVCDLDSVGLRDLVLVCCLICCCYWFRLYWLNLFGRFFCWVVVV